MLIISIGNNVSSDARLRRTTTRPLYVSYYYYYYDTQYILYYCYDFNPFAFSLRCATGAYYNVA